MRSIVILIVIGLLAFSFQGRFGRNILEGPDLAIDHRAVSVLRGAITHVRDGDTFEVNGIPVRISALDCAENSTAEGKKITRFAKQFKGKETICELTGAKTYDRVVGYCSINGIDFGKMMMDENGMEMKAHVRTIGFKRSSMHKQ